jgi:hypothetical protein
LTGVLPLPSHFEQRGGNIRRPGSFGCTTGTKPVPLQPEHARSSMGSFGQSALLVRIAFPRLILPIIFEYLGLLVYDFSVPGSSNAKAGPANWSVKPHRMRKFTADVFPSRVAISP